MQQKNQLFPVFFRLDRLKVLVVGAGEVGYEKLFFMLKSSPITHVKIVAPEINDRIWAMMEGYYETSFKIEQKEFSDEDVEGYDLVIAATNIESLNKEVWKVAKAKGKLVNVADTPDLCDFYLGSIVTKGHLKIAISTNGKSPTLAKRLRQVFEEVFPEDTNQLLQNLHAFRGKLKRNFEEKVKILNDLTKSMIELKEFKN
ncbi:precorrin-2 dehydrogenase/sirohydrochlorin ferrochelatase family protein [Portibacter marinus]|uniref:precorrin-2 dehydrogenase/sirohydrochlorin ferrochelatase family protein n=1 Tax=Portibacter marinus TaxID=2898660 RepID=UPI001F29FC6E|nr:bifunctional precorrin-2 dehydrogenase/sirohydrochlorin ferrochelatase [Portibacter marinus]